MAAGLNLLGRKCAGRAPRPGGEGAGAGGAHPGARGREGEIVEAEGRDDGGEAVGACRRERELIAGRHGSWRIPPEERVGGRSKYPRATVSRQRSPASVSWVCARRCAPIRARRSAPELC